ncbi:dihydrofolate reductase isoform X1 [Latimeria chalumnae]|uniref:dihydrofolate reductase n=1 Tax=Latimeria chalumnae TaxID=7897 RepID=H3ADL5_LATCH|nr:PREDICTED: dihydrofolate reductase isoform X1 [Latimeria chalumnae]|eukprot:XP_006004435.1 PREDICTED: dihydrofolate reductase isoform X1 [Latimeria chalumnae]
MGAARLLNSIVAVCPNLGIGKDGNLPWHPKRLSNEFRYFQKMTTTPTVEGKQNVVIMGRKTWFSIPEKNRPLKGRVNVVLSRELQEAPEGAHYLARDLDSALKLLESPELADRVDLVWIIGGSALYKEALEHPSQHRLFVTRVLQQFECDTYLPEINFNKFTLLPDIFIRIAAVRLGQRSTFLKAELPSFPRRYFQTRRRRGSQCY